MNGESALAPWESADHWREGDSALWICDSPNGVYERLISIVSPSDAIVCDPAVTYNEGVFTLAEGFRDVRHCNSCGPCATSVDELRQRGGRDASEYWTSRIPRDMRGVRSGQAWTSRPEGGVR